MAGKLKRCGARTNGLQERNALHYQDGPVRTVAIGLSQKDFPNGEGHA
jgi:hypothetical protein